MEKIKIGMLGEGALLRGISLVSSFENAQLISLFVPNKNQLDKAISYAKEQGIYIKSYNNADDFYQTNPDMIIADAAMFDYAFCENLFFTSVPEDSPSEGAAAQSGEKLCFFHNNKWVAYDFSSLSPQNHFDYIKSGKDPLHAYFMIKTLYN